jgi:hypothetical protein
VKIDAVEVKKLHKKIKNLTGKKVLEAQIETAERTQKDTSDKLKAERARRKAAENKVRELEAEPAVESDSSPDSSPPKPDAKPSRHRVRPPSLHPPLLQPASPL